MSSKEEAVDHFLNLYQDKTGNAWHSTNFTKYPNKFYPLEIDYGQVSVLKWHKSRHNQLLDQSNTPASLKT